MPDSIEPSFHRARASDGRQASHEGERDISRYLPDIQKIFRAMKRYGLIVAESQWLTSRCVASVNRPGASSAAQDIFLCPRMLRFLTGG